MRVRARVRFSHLNFTHRLLRRVSLVFVPLQHVIAKALRCLVLRDVRLCSRFWRRDLRRTSFCGEVAGFLDPSFRFGMIRQHVLEAHDDFGQHTERGMHVLSAAEVLRGKRVELLRVRVDAFDRKRFPFKSLDVNLLRAFASRTFTLAGAALDATHEGGGFLFGGIGGFVSRFRCKYLPRTDTFKKQQFGSHKSEAARPDIVRSSHKLPASEAHHDPRPPSHLSGLGWDGRPTF